MPELPEVEVVRRGFARHCQGLSIQSITVYHPRTVRHMQHAPESMHTMFAGASIAQVCRRGKFMWVEFSEPNLPALVIHLGMSGQLRIFPQAQVEPPRHGRLRMQFTDGSEMWFVDQRTFGYFDPVDLVPDPFGFQDHIPERIAHIGADLLEYPDPASAVPRLLARKTTVKRALLDQNVIAGIGNIYCDEMSWQAQLHPEQPLAAVTSQQAEVLLDAGQQIMRAAISVGGTSFDELYVNVNGQSGYFDLSLHAYGRGGQSCHRCNSILVRDKCAGRGTVFCPSCQQISEVKKSKTIKL